MRRRGLRGTCSARRRRAGSLVPRRCAGRTWSSSGREPPPWATPAPSRTRCRPPTTITTGAPCFHLALSILLKRRTSAMHRTRQRPSRGLTPSGFADLLIPVAAVMKSFSAMSRKRHCRQYTILIFDDIPFSTHGAPSFKTSSPGCV